MQNVIFLTLWKIIHGDTASGPERKLSVSLKFRSTVLKLLRLEPCLLQQALLKSYFSRNVFNLDYTLYLYSFLWISNSSRVNWWMSGVYDVIQEPKQTTNVFRRALAHWAQVLPVLPYRKKPTPPLQCLQRRTATQAEWKRGGVKWIISEFFMFEAGVFCVYFNNLEWGVFFAKTHWACQWLTGNENCITFLSYLDCLCFFFLLVLDICATQILADVLPSWTDDPLSCSA